MQKFLMAVWSSAKPGQEADYNDWYETVHLAEICAIPGVVSGRRYETSPVSPAAPDADYLALYEIEAADPAGVLAEIGRRGQSGEMKVPDSLDLASTKMLILKQRV
jgi:hypothetical protein